MPGVEKLIASSFKSGRMSKAAEVKLQADLKATLKKWKKEQKEKAKKKTEKNGGDEVHAPSYGDLSAVLWRSGDYNKNMSLYLRKDSGIGSARGGHFEMNPSRVSRIKKAYSTEYTAPVAVEHIISNWGIKERNENFNSEAELGAKKAGCEYPYTWSGHHMIPCGAFYQGQKKRPKNMISGVFSDDEYALLLMSDFNVNHGQNVIPLPRNQMAVQPAFDMLLHPSNHTKYTRSVQTKMQEISSQLKKLAGKADEPHPDISVEIAEELSFFEDDLWEILTEAGKEMVDSIVEKRQRKFKQGQDAYVSDEGKLK